MNKWKPIGNLDETDENDKVIVWEMSNISRRVHPELPANIYISPRNANHGPRIKVQRNKGHSTQIHDSFSMTISDNPSIIGNIGTEITQKDIEYLKKFIIRNKDILLDLWNDILTPEEVLPNLVYSENPKTNED